MNAPTYIPRFGSLADRVIDYFGHNPDEELSQLDISQKFDVPRSSIKNCLDPAVMGGRLIYAQNDDLTYVYTLAGRDKSAKPKADAPSTHTTTPPSAPAPAAERAKPARSSSTAQRALTAPRRGVVSVPAESLDFSGLKAERGVPLGGKGKAPPGVSKWEPLFEMVNEPDLSVPFPAKWKSAVAAQATKRNVAAKKAGEPTHYVVRLTSATEARIWRTA